MRKGAPPCAYLRHPLARRHLGTEDGLRRLQATAAPRLPPRGPRLRGPRPRSAPRTRARRPGAVGPRDRGTLPPANPADNGRPPRAGDSGPPPGPGRGGLDGSRELARFVRRAAGLGARGGTRPWRPTRGRRAPGGERSGARGRGLPIRVLVPRRRRTPRPGSLVPRRCKHILAPSPCRVLVLQTQLPAAPLANFWSPLDTSLPLSGPLPRL